MSFFNELKRRNVFRVGIAYTVAAWVLLQVVDLVLDNIAAPDWVMKVFLLVVIVGFPVAIVIAWAFEVTPDGIKRESEIDRSQSIVTNTGHKLDRIIMAFLVLAVVLLLSDRFMRNEELPASAAPVDTVVENIETASPVTANPVAASPTKANPATDIQSIAVLPFVNMSSDTEQEYFSDGLSEELLNRLAQNPKLHVAARTSAFQFKGKNLDIGNIGRQLNVANVLEGSVRKSGNRLRITAQLIRVDSGFHLWSQTFDREIDDIFAIQDDISTAITQALEIELGARVKQASDQPTDNLKAYQLFLKARYLLAQRGGDHMLEAIRLFKQATDLDQRFAKAWSGMAFTYALMPAYSSKVPSDEARQSGMEAARMAIQLDPDNAEAYTAMGRIEAHLMRDISTARKNFEKSIELAPNNAEVVNLYGDFLTMIGDFRNAEITERRAIDLDPLAAVHYADLAFLYLILNRNKEALVQARTSAKLAPDSYDRHDALITALIMTGDFAAAGQMIDFAATELGADAGYVNSWWGLYYYRQGDRENLRIKMDERMQQAELRNGYFISTNTAFFAMALDGVDAAIRLLEKSYQANEAFLIWPEFFYLPEQFSDDPQWRAFWQQPGLSEIIEVRRQFGPYEHVGYWEGVLPE